MMYIYCVLIFATVVGVIKSDNVGWKEAFKENVVEFHDLPLKWEKGESTNVPDWITGIYVRNGPAQVLLSSNLSRYIIFYQLY